MKELYDLLPDIMVYIIAGFILIKTFNFVALKQSQENVKHMLILSLIVGLIIVESVKSFSIDIPFESYFVFELLLWSLLSVLLGYILGKAMRSRILIDILDKLKIRDTPNVYYWDNILDDNEAMRVLVEYEDCSYEGMLHDFESYSNTPHVVLAAYVKLNNKGNIEEDNRDNGKKIIILDTQKAKRVEVIYCDNSYKCKDIEMLCICRKDFEDERRVEMKDKQKVEKNDSKKVNLLWRLYKVINMNYSFSKWEEEVKTSLSTKNRDELEEYEKKLELLNKNADEKSIVYSFCFNVFFPITMAIVATITTIFTMMSTMINDSIVVLYEESRIEPEKFLELQKDTFSIMIEGLLELTSYIIIPLLILMALVLMLRYIKNRYNKLQMIYREEVIKIIGKCKK